MAKPGETPPFSEHTESQTLTLLFLQRNQGSWQELSATPLAHLATVALSCQQPEKMKASMVLSLIGYLVVPSGAAIMGRCVVAKKLKDGGLDHFEGYSLANCEWAPLSPFSPPLLLLWPLPRRPQLRLPPNHPPPVPS